MLCPLQTFSFVDSQQQSINLLPHKPLPGTFLGNMLHGAELSSSFQLQINGAICFFKFILYPKYKIDSTGSLRFPPSCSCWKTFLGTFWDTDSQLLRRFLQTPAALSGTRVHVPWDRLKHRHGILSNMSPVPQAWLVPLVMAFEPMRTPVNGI